MSLVSSHLARLGLAAACGAAMFAPRSVTQEPQQAPKRPTQDEAARALDREIAELVPQQGSGTVVAPPATTRELGSAGPFKLYDLSFDLLFAGGASTETDSDLENLQGGGHDPRKRGFTVQNAELSLRGAIDPYFRADLHLITFIDPFEGETVVELEEAFLTTTSLPGGFELEAGQSFTEFGRHNPNHPHQWDFLDAPVINTRIFGPDGMRGPGLRLGWLSPLPWFSELHGGVQNANGETMASFLANDEYFAERPVGGRPFHEREVSSAADLAWLLRWVNAFDPADGTTVQLGLSALFGPNAAGASTGTRVYGADLVVRFSDEFGGRQANELVWQTEFIARDYETDTFTDAGDPNDPGDDVTVPGETLKDHGFYTQLTWRFEPSWRSGLRFDRASGAGDGYDAQARAISPRADDPFRNDRWRLSPMLEWSATEYSRVRLQYNYDDVPTADGGEAHSVWLGFEVALGAHAAHRF